MSFRRKAKYLLSLVTFIMLTSCINDRLDACPDDNKKDIVAYLELTVTTSGSTGTRANPTGGEEGDGYEHGRDNENTIHDLTIFLYQDNDKGLDGEYTVRWRKYIDPATVEIVDDAPEYIYDRIYNLRIPLDKADFEVFQKFSENLRCVVIANAANLPNIEINSKSSIKDLCDYLAYGQAWRGETVADADWFVMSPAFNGAKCNQNSSRYYDGMIRSATTDDGIVYSGETTLERVAARIDLQFSDNPETPEKGLYEKDSKNLKYKVKDVNHTLSITSVVPVNLMQKNSYLIKHLTENTNIDNVLIAADEITDNSKPVNYVLTPYFKDKENVGESYLTDWYGESRAGFLRNQTDNLFWSKYGLESFGTPIDIPDDSNGNKTDDKSLIITYANENTHPEELQVTKYEDDGTTVATRPSDYLTGLLFRAQYHPEKVYTSGVIGDDAPSEKYTDGNNFWLFRTVGANNTIAVEEKYNIYFASENALNEYVATLPAGGRYETVYYPGGICYYNVWIKHANIDDSDENFPMKYGIVRNNIYRISLNFNGIGQPTPEITEPRNVTSRIYVIKWNFRPQKPIIM